MEDMVRQSHSSAKQFVVDNVTETVGCRNVWRAVPVAPRAIQHRVDALAVWRFGHLVRPRHALAAYVRRAATVAAHVRLNQRTQSRMRLLSAA